MPRIIFALAAAIAASPALAVDECRVLHRGEAYTRCQMSADQQRKVCEVHIVGDPIAHCWRSGSDESYWVTREEALR